jgi:hypothetical protein
MERGDWKRRGRARGAADQVRPVQAITHFARALGAARSGKPDAAQADIAKLAELRDKLREAKDAYWAEQVDIQWQDRDCLAAIRAGQVRRGAQGHGARRRRRGQDREGAGDAGPARAGARALWAMLLERGKAKEALAAFEATLKKEPHRLGATLGRRRRRSNWAMPPRLGNTMPPRSRSARMRAGPARDCRGARVRRKAN